MKDSFPVLPISSAVLDKEVNTDDENDSNNERLELLSALVVSGKYLLK